MAEYLQEALLHHQAGRLDQAELLYRRILDENPQHPDALHLLGVVAHQRGDARRAIELMGQAVRLRPTVASFHYNLGEAYRLAGQLGQAAHHCETALQLNPDSPEAHNNMGLVLQAQGQRQQAIDHFRQATQLRPDFVLALNNLANALREQGQPDDAVAAFRQCLELQPDLPEANCNLGQMLLERGRADEALGFCRRAVELKADFPEAQNNLGNVLRELNRLDEAKDCYARAINLNPKLGMAYNNMGQALQEEGKLDEALRWYEKALAIEPRSARFLCNQASALYAQEKEAEAVSQYRLALDIDPHYAEAHNGLGYIHQERGDSQLALECYRRALQLKPEFAAGQVNLGQVLEEMGQLTEAKACFREALRLEPKHAGALGSLATMLRAKLPAADAAIMESLLAEGSLSDSRRSTLHHGLAHYYDAKGDYTHAADHIHQGNAFHWQSLVKQNKGYSPPEHSRFVDRLIEKCNESFFARIQGWGLASQAPIFVLGMPRSGTTLLEQILASHSQVFGAGELRFVRDVFESLPSVVGAAVSSADCLEQLSQASLHQVAEKTLAQLQQFDPAAERVVDKMPDNYLYLGLIAAMFPRARVIHSRRDLRDVAVSCWITNFKSIRWACRLDHIAARIHDYQRLMGHWRKTLPFELMEIDYEDTVTDLEGVARRMLEFCGLDWDARCLEFHQTRRPIRTASVMQVRQPIYTRSVQRWKHYQEHLPTSLT